MGHTERALVRAVSTWGPGGPARDVFPWESQGTLLREPEKEEGDVRGSWGQDRRYGVVEEELGVQSPGPGDR